MKKVLFILLSVLIAVMMVFPAFAEENDTVTVNISTGEEVQIVTDVKLKDADGDGAITISDALKLAHDSAYNGGSSAGYGTSDSEYGKSLTKLWGIENGGAYGYYVNNTAAVSLADTIKAGDHIYAFVYTDKTTWSDAYSFFDKYEITGKKGDTVTLTLSRCGFDESWNPVVTPTEGAEIVLDATPTGVKTDAEGKATFKLTKTGTVVISAVSGDYTLVPPICLATVSSNSTLMIIIICAAVALIVIVAAVLLAKGKKK